MRTRTRNPAPPSVPLDSSSPKAPARVGGLASFLDGPVKQRARHQRLSDLDIAMRNAEARAKSGEWDGADGRIFVGLYAMLHVRVYRARPSELEGKAEMRAASGAARRILGNEFGDDPDAMVEYVKWAWKREKKRHEWARSQQRDRSRLAWRWLFSAAMVTDYRVDKTDEKIRGRV